jgi:hypothetical protein
VLVYRTELEEGAVVTAMSARPLGTGPRLGAVPMQAYRITVRYALPDGRGGVRRGRLLAALPMGTALVVAGYHRDGRGVVASLRPTGSPRPGRGAAVADRFRLPVALQAWGVTAVSGAALRVDGALRAGGGALTVRGAVRLRLRTPSGEFALRIPFVRVLDGFVPGLRWRLRVGVTGLRVRVEPGGRLQGEVAVALRAEGRPAPVGARSGGGEPLALVREVAGEVRGLAAEGAGAGQAVVRGTVELDVYGIDRRGRSRWTGRSLPFTALVEVAPAVGPGDRLEATAAIERLTHAHGHVQVLMAFAVTVLRSVTIVAGDGQRYRVEQVVGTAAGALALREALYPQEGDAVPDGEEAVVRELPLPGPGAWTDLTVALHATADAGDGAGTRSAAGRWRVRAALEGSPAGEAADPVSLRASAGGTAPNRAPGGVAATLGPQDDLAVVPSLLRVDGNGLHVRAALLWGPPLPPVDTGAPTATGAPAETEAHAEGGLRTVSGAIPAPGSVRRVVRLVVSPAAGGRLAVEALLGLDGVRRLVRVAGAIMAPAPAPGRPVSALAYPVLHGDRWQLHLTIACQSSEG